jgi:hypothetical protein
MNAPITRFWCGAALLLLTQFVEAGATVAALPPKPLPDGAWSARAGDLSILLRQEDTGIRLLSLQDSALGEELLSTNQSPLFNLTLLIALVPLALPEVARFQGNAWLIPKVVHSPSHVAVPAWRAVVRRSGVR